jgi:hypothetical protein
VDRVRQRIPSYLAERVSTYDDIVSGRSGADIALRGPATVVDRDLREAFAEIGKVIADIRSTLLRDALAAQRVEEILDDAALGRAYELGADTGTETAGDAYRRLLEETLGSYRAAASVALVYDAVRADKYSVLEYILRLRAQQPDDAATADATILKRSMTSSPITCSQKRSGAGTRGCSATTSAGCGTRSCTSLACLWNGTGSSSPTTGHSAQRSSTRPGTRLRESEPY